MEKEFASVRELVRWLLEEGDEMLEAAKSQNSGEAKERCRGRMLALYSLATQLATKRIILQGLAFDAVITDDKYDHSLNNYARPESSLETNN